MRHEEQQAYIDLLEEGIKALESVLRWDLHTLRAGKFRQSCETLLDTAKKTLLKWTELGEFDKDTVILDLRTISLFGEALTGRMIRENNKLEKYLDAFHGGEGTSPLFRLEHIKEQNITFEEGEEDDR